MYVVRGRKALNMDKKSKVANQERISRRADGDRIDERFGFVRLTEVMIKSFMHWHLYIDDKLLCM